MTDIIKPFGDELPPVIEPETLALLKSLRLEITPHTDRSYGYGYNWGGLEWVGPYPTEGAAVQAAFEDAIRARIARAEAPFAAAPGYPTKNVPDLADCLRLVKRCKPTVALALYLGDPGWMTGQEAHELIVNTRAMGGAMGLYWNAYIEDGWGTDPAGIYTFDPHGKAWRAFEVELTERFYEAQRATIHFVREPDPKED